MFDTIVLRNIYNPEDLFSLVYKISGVKDFSSQRKNAQREAFIEMQRNGHKEISMSDIYKHLTYTKDLREELRSLEEKLETEIATPNPYMKKIYNYTVNTGKRIVITTDMYLGRNLIEKILANCGYAIYEKIFISSENHATKRDAGDLFQIVIKEMQTKPAKILHIGDSVRGDVKMAYAKGLKTEHYKRNIPKRIKFPFSQEADTFLNALYANYVNDPLENTSWTNIGYTYGGILHYGFLKWLNNTTIREKIDIILFVSRDGYLLDKCYNRYYNNIAHQYIYGSRVSFSIPLINHENFEQYLDFLTSGYLKLSLYEIFDRVLLPLPDITFIKETGFKNYYDIIDTEYKTNQIKQLLGRMKNLICEKAVIQYEYALEYFRNIIAGRKRVAFVDIGWEASTQVVFEKLMNKLDPQIEVVGYYFALLDTPNVHLRSETARMKAYICEPGRNVTANNLFSRNRALIELLFTAPHESVSSYEKKENNIIPNYIHPKGTTNDFSKIAFEINKGITSFVEDMTLLVSKYNFAIADVDVIKPLERLINFPSLEESELIGELHNSDGWASTVNKKEFFAYEPTLRNILNKNFTYIWDSGINTRYKKKAILSILRKLKKTIISS